MIRCYIGLGSNLENPLLQISMAIEALEAMEEISLAGTSSIYQSTPYGPIDQPDFINAVVSIDTELKATELLNHLLTIENVMGRTRSKEKWGPRKIDLDILVYGEEIIEDKDLFVPHPEISKRNFVLYPLYELDSQINIPGLGPLEGLIKNTTMDGLKIMSRCR